jgi:hypothetical protein
MMLRFIVLAVALVSLTSCVSDTLCGGPDCHYQGNL